MLRTRWLHADWRFHPALHHDAIPDQHDSLMTKPLLELKWALVFALATLGWLLVERVFGLHTTRIELHATLTILYAIPATAVYVLALRDKRKSLGGAMTYLQGLVSGAWITLFVTLLNPLTQTVALMVVTPAFLENMAAYSVSSGALSLAEAESYFSLGNYIKQGLAASPVMGAVTTAVVAFFMRGSRTEAVDGSAA